MKLSQVAKGLLRNTAQASLWRGLVPPSRSSLTAHQRKDADGGPSPTMTTDRGMPLTS